MTIELQYRIKNDPHALLYLRQNSFWYKYLNRNPAVYKQFENEMKAHFSLRVTDKIANTLKTIELLENVISSLK